MKRLRWLAWFIVAAVLVLLGLVMGFLSLTSPALADQYTKWPGWVLLNSDTLALWHYPNATRPRYGQTIPAGGGGTHYQIPIMAATADSGFLILNDGTPVSDGADGRNRYSKISFWNTDGTLGYVENQNNTAANSNCGCATVANGTGGDYIVDGMTMKPLWRLKSCPILSVAGTSFSNDSRWHPGPLYPDILVGVRHGGPVDSLIMVNVRTCGEMKAFPLTIKASGSPFTSEGNPSNDGRYWFVAADLDGPVADSIQIVDTFRDVVWPAWSAVPLAATSPLATTGSGSRPINDPNRCAIGNIMISPKGKFLLIKYAATPEWVRVFAFDTTAHNFKNQIMPADVGVPSNTPGAAGLRRCCAAIDSLEGWLYPLKHPDVMIDSDTTEVIVGKDACGSSLCIGNISYSDSGQTVMVRIWDGMVRHVSAGKRPTVPGAPGIATEGTSNHITGRNIHRPGWAFTNYDQSSGNPPPDSTARFQGSLVGIFLEPWSLRNIRPMVNLAPHRSVWSGTSCVFPALDCYRAESHLCPSPDGRMMVFPSSWRAFTDPIVAGKPSGTWRHMYMIDFHDTLTYYVRGNRGDDITGDGSFQKPFRTISKVNCVLRDGDTADIDSLNSADTASTLTNRIYPRRSGSPGRCITYRGDVGHPTRLVVPDVVLEQRCISVRGFRIRDNIRFDWVDTLNAKKLGVPADWDSVSWCLVGWDANRDTAKIGGVTFNGVTWPVVKNCQVWGPIKFFAATQAGAPCSTAACANTTPTSFATVSKNRLRIGRIAPTEGTPFFQRYGIWMTGRAQFCDVDSNVCSASFDTTAIGAPVNTANAAFMVMGRSTNNQSVANHWRDTTVTADGSSGGRWKLLALRDSVPNFLALSDTMELDTTSSLLGTNFADYEMGLTGRQVQNKFRKNTIKTNGHCGYSATNFSAVVDSNVFISSRSDAFQLTGQSINCDIENNTFIAYNGYAVNWLTPPSVGGTTKQLVNYFWRARTHNDSCVVNYASIPSNSVFTSDNNFYSSPMAADSMCQMIQWLGTSHSSAGLECSGVGPPPFPGFTGCLPFCWTLSTGQDWSSNQGEGNFVDVGVTRTVGDLSCISAAVTPSGGYYGARTPSPFITANSGIGNLIATGSTTGTISIQFTEPMAGGPGVSYDIRRSLAPINNVNDFYAATSVPGVGSVGPGNVIMATVDGLTPDTQYYIAVMAVGACLQSGGSVSNVVCAYTAPISGPTKTCP